MTVHHNLVIAVDWSASSTVGPKTPSADRCWIAHTHGDAPPSAEYFRTRVACEARITELLDRHRVGATVGFDVAIGYPTLAEGHPVLPAGRALTSLVRSLIEDRDDGTNNRFWVAAELNRRIRTITGDPDGPFWGRPKRLRVTDLEPTKPRASIVPERRAIERRLRDQKHRIMSPFQLMGAGAVGSQSLLALPVIDRLLERLGPRGVLWPFEIPEREDSVVIAEIWPSLCDLSGIDHPIKDARQVIAACRALRACDTSPTPEHAGEGWILNAT